MGGPGPPGENEAPRQGGQGAWLLLEVAPRARVLLRGSGAASCVALMSRRPLKRGWPGRKPVANFYFVF